MTLTEKLDTHLVAVLSSPGDKINKRYAKILCGMADEPQRMAALDRARVREPFLLPSEETEALLWARLIQ